MARTPPSTWSSSVADRPARSARRSLYANFFKTGYDTYTRVITWSGTTRSPLHYAPTGSGTSSSPSSWLSI